MQEKFKCKENIGYLLAGWGVVLRADIWPMARWEPPHLPNCGAATSHDLHLITTVP